MPECIQVAVNQSPKTNMNIFGIKIGRDNQLKEIQKEIKTLFDSYFLSGKEIESPEKGNCNSNNNLNAYADSTWVYACVSRVAQDIAALPLKLYKNVDGKKTQIEEHLVLDALSFVNNNMTGYDLIEWMVSSLELTGNSYTNVSKTKPVTLFPYIPSLIKPEASTDAAKPISKYLYTPASSEIPITVEEMLHIKYYNPLLTGYILGMSTLAAIRYAYQTDKESVLWNFNSIKKGCAIDVILETDNPAFNDVNKRNEAIDSWNQRYSGKAGDKTALLFGGMKANKIGLTQKDMEFLEQRKVSREEILAGFKVPPAVLGLFEYANYANAEMQEKFYWRNGLLPRIRKIESGLNEKLLPMFPGTDGLFLAFDISQVEALQTTFDNKIKNCVSLFSMGVPYNKIAEAFDLPVKNIDGGDVGYIAFNLSPIGNAAPEPATAKPVKKPKVLTKLTPAQKELKWKRFVKLTDKLENKFKPVVKKYFTKQEAIVQSNLSKYKSVKKKVNIDNILFDMGKEGSDLAAILTPIMANIIKQQAIEEIDNFNFDISFDISSQSVVDWIKARGMKSSTEVNQTTIDAIRTTLTDGINNSETIDELSKRIAEVYGQARDYRTDVIARTETISASNEANLEVYKQAGVNAKKCWLTAGDELVRDSHIQAGKDYDDAGAIDLDEDFVLIGGSGQAPGEIDSAAESCNCRCSVYPVIEKE